ncbi:type II secretion system protein [Paucibacter sp. APW11]|uniref:Type II secretion system protein n=1 Tax=Roseateles aquae TaxID=3077235 RepID=A0ABU3P854_9BURK|nr:type II secretion system protein [Paucibacter sp. APW11]MDT8998750.1 type II secretion system protein [Paucibacter sp. APW11]
MPSSRRQLSGFTLIEAVLVIVLTGVLMVIVAQFIVTPVQIYLNTNQRVQLVNQADLSLRRMARELAISLPNSVRVTSTASSSTLELIPSTGAARYASEGAGKLDFGTLDTSFDLVGLPLTLAASQQLVFYNLGPSVPDANAYADNSSAVTQASSNRRMATNGAGSASTITISSLAALPATLLAPPFRVYAVEQPITYRCDRTAGTLTRYSGYGFVAVQPDPPSGGSSALLARGVSACNFSYENAIVAARAALVSLSLSLTAKVEGPGSGTETVSLYRAVHVDNLP